MKIDAEPGREEGLNALRLQAGDAACEHVPGARGGEGRIGAWTAQCGARAVRHYSLRALQHEHLPPGRGAVACRIEAVSLDVSNGAVRQSRQFAGMRREYRPAREVLVPARYLRERIEGIGVGYDQGVSDGRRRQQATYEGLRTWRLAEPRTDQQDVVGSQRL